MISDLARDAQNDAKGSAGDKHETALAMMHLEQEKLNHKLAENLNQKAIVDKINAGLTQHKVALGSLVKANNMIFYISAAMPKIKMDNNTIIAVSAQSPLGTALMGKQVGDTLTINEINYIISDIE